ncbi:UV radiation resistance protein and autophagy-related subunit 14 family protein [Acanthocheilonema viteae]
MNTRSNLPYDYAMNVNRIATSISEARKGMRCFTDIGELVNCRDLIDTPIDITPLGIYTRINSIMSSPRDDSDSNSIDWTDDKYPCTSCTNLKLCLCRSCVNHKIRYVDKYKLQRRKEYGNHCFAREIESILESNISLVKTLHSTHESIEYLKQNILDRKKAIKKKKAALKVICNKTERYRKTIEELKDRCQGHQKVLCGPPNSLQTFVDAYEDKLQKIVKFNAQWFLKIFPIQRVLRLQPIIDDVEKRCREMIAEACQEFAPSTDKVLAPMECRTSSEPCYTICDCDAPDRAQYKILKGWLSIGIPTVPVARPVHNMFAAFVYTIQLVNLLTVNFDACIPEQISYQEFSSCRKWTDGLFDTDIFKLNRAVVMLCLSLGIESKLIEPLNPFANLLLLSNIVNDSNSVLKPGYHTLANDLAVVLEDDLRQISWAERERTEEDGWYMVRYRDNYYDETYDVSTPLRPIPSLSDLEEMLRDFSAFASPSSRMSEHDFQCILEDASRQHSPEFLPRVLGIFRNFSSK